jgi:hypothetical protein
MRTGSSLVFLTGFFVIATLSACATTRHGDIEDRLIASFAEKCKTVEYKVHGDREIYVIDATMRKSENGCPIAVIKGWRDGSLFREREVEICECRERRGR